MSLIALRADAVRFLCLCVMVLALPALQPVAEARALETGLTEIICTQSAVPDSDDLPRPVGECLCIVACTGMTDGKSAKAILANDPSALLLKAASFRPNNRLDQSCGTQRQHIRGIRGPPILI